MRLCRNIEIPKLVYPEPSKKEINKYEIRSTKQIRITKHKIQNKFKTYNNVKREIRETKKAFV
ncbi:hypothetical protein KsCSTR_22100 [Candidatus Kuenenia stuttgartiensis]|uniref:Uncharacterized protein n=1 Tax=Kuenenia stuttgartiensis TaxID=174633 RepID=A0A2C9CAL2_KUEST|nr:hypothetical protein KsCSTR_22100 [Candidatus Kuenenia stuttgartiensis]GJQ49520.1 MAG: hypothetical protein HKUEN01_19060 [Candidatus Kuenenia stuttgartiensis]SOH02705.1 hypothetical protein KSMBR1_0187 [Candidatus Kuenenia stuttgartiensis]